MKLKQIRAKDLVKALIKKGFVIKRQQGSHVFLESLSGKKRIITTISIHQGCIPLGTLRAILKQTEVKEEELKRLL